MKKVLAVILVISMVLALFVVRTVPASAAGFSDVPATYWAKDQIDYLVGKGIIMGFSDGTFKPESPVTREQFAKMICIAKGLKEYKPSTTTFKDVSTSHWSYGFVEAAVKAGYIKGYPNGNFGPSDLIKREDMALLLIRAIGKEKEANDPNLVIATFSNDEGQIDSYAKGAMTLAVRPINQFLTWDSLRDLRPQVPATRAESVYAIYMMIHPPKKGGILTLGLWAEPDTLFYGLSGLGPMMDTLAGCGGESPNNTIGLTGTAANGVLYPYVAENIPNIRDGTWVVNEQTHTMITTWHLRKGAKWSDGVPITSHDLVFSEKMTEDPLVATVSKFGTDYIDHVEAPDPYTFVVYWKQINIYASQGHALYPAHILEPIYEKDPASINSCAYNEHPIYAGPYMLDTWSHGNYLLFKRNPNYWAGEGLVDNYVMKIFPDTNTMLMNLIAGSIDVTPLGLGMDLRQVASAEQQGITKNFNVYYLPAAYFEHMTVNLTDPLLKDKTLRQALMYAMDRKALNAKMFMGKRVISNGPTLPGTLAEANDLNPYNYDPTRAKNLLRDAGYTWNASGNCVNPQGQVVKLTVSAPAGNVNRQQQISFIGSLWKDNLGIEVTYRPVVGIFKYLSNGDFQLAMWATFSGDKEDCAQWLYSSGNTANDKSMPNVPTQENGYIGQDYERFVNTDFDELAIEYITNISEAQRIIISKKMEKILNEELPDLYITWYVSSGFVRKNIHGTDFGPAIGLSQSYDWNIDYWWIEK
jgi:peptide/nickel transport system substrate-binding protein